MLRPLAAALAICALAPAAAQAATLTLDGAHTMHYTAAPGEENRLSMWVLDVGYGVVKDDGVPGLTGCDGPLIMEGWRHCVNGRRPQVKLGDMDDVANIADGGSDEMLWIYSAHVDGGPGDDDVRTGSDDDTILGGPGADTFEGHDGNETIDAVDGAGTDTITCHGGTDTVKADHDDTVGAGCETVELVGKPVLVDDNGYEPKPPPPAQGEQPAEQTPPPPTDTGAPVSPARGDVTPPALTVKVKKRRRGRMLVTVTSDENATLDGAGKARALFAGKPIRFTMKAQKRFRLTARDAAGNIALKDVKVR
ncbi:MAG: hypothetical protein M3389_13985 [Actinomycetota bacterium]|nr:hypothetical protein [Actinomycetota bacterium]